MEEIWKDVKGYEGLYMISNLGRVKTLPRRVKSKTGFRILNEKIHKPCDNGNGYKYVSFKINGEKTKHKYIHKMVSESFLDNPNNYPEVNHIDADKSNNNIYNLEWCSKKQNMRHAHDNGLINYVKGEDSPSAKLKEEEVISIRLMYSSGNYTQKKLSDMFGVCPQYISNIVRRVKWKHI